MVNALSLLSLSAPSAPSEPLPVSTVPSGDGRCENSCSGGARGNGSEFSFHHAGPFRRFRTPDIRPSSRWKTLTTNWLLSPWLMITTTEGWGKANKGQPAPSLKTTLVDRFTQPFHTHSGELYYMSRCVTLFTLINMTCISQRVPGSHIPRPIWCTVCPNLEGIFAFSVKWKTNRFVQLISCLWCLRYSHRNRKLCIFLDDRRRWAC